MAENIIETLTAEIRADISNFSDGLRSASQQMKELGGKLTTSLTLPIVGFGVAALKSFSDSETALSQLNAVLKSTKGVAGVTAKAATDLATALQKVTRYSDEDVLSAENMLLTFTSIGKNVFPDATKVVLDMSTALGQDLKSSAIQLGKALQDPINGVTALRRVGVNFTDAQKKQIEAMVKAGNVAGAQRLILKELQTEFGGSAVAAGDTFAGSLDKLKNKFDDLLEVIGGKLAPTVEKVIGFLSGLIDRISALPPGVIEVAIALAAIVAAAGPVLSILGTIGTLIGIVFSPVGLIIAGIVAVLKIASDHFGGLGNMMKIAADAADKLVKIVGYELFDTLNKASTAAGQLSAIVGFFLFRTLTDAATAAKQLAELALLTLFDWLNRARTAATQLAAIMGFALSAAATWVKARFDELIKTIDTTVTKLRMALAVIQELQRQINGGGGYVAPESATGVHGSGFSSTPSGGGGGRNGSFTSFATGGYTGSGSGIAGMVHGSEYVVPQGGALVSTGGGYRGPDTVHVVLKADQFEDHVYVNIANALAASRN